jgi:hypothetical protein
MLRKNLIFLLAFVPLLLCGCSATGWAVGGAVGYAVNGNAGAKTGAMVGTVFPISPHAVIENYIFPPPDPFYKRKTQHRELLQ